MKFIVYRGKVPSYKALELKVPGWGLPARGIGWTRVLGLNWEKASSINCWRLWKVSPKALSVGLRAEPAMGKSMS